MVQRTLFDEINEKKEKQKKEEKTSEQKEEQQPTKTKKITISIMPSGDCEHREKNRCLKTGKTITVDAREPDRNSCWNRMNCEHFKKRGEEK